MSDVNTLYMLFCFIKLFAGEGLANVYSHSTTCSGGTSAYCSGGTSVYCSGGTSVYCSGGITLHSETLSLP